MPLGYECRAKLIKQNPAIPTVRRGPISIETGTPGPDHYDTPQICGGNGYSKIRRAPAYTFGRKIKYCFPKPAVAPNAPMLNISGIGERGSFRIPGGLVTPHIEPPPDNMKVPGPGAYTPQTKMRIKREPAYSLRPAAKPQYQPFDEWTPPPNMYCPPIPSKRAPAITFGYGDRTLTTAYMPGPGEHNPNYNIVKKNKPAYSFGYPFRPVQQPITPSPNTYCEKKYMVSKPTVPAPSFGIRHSPYLGKEEEHLKSSKLDLLISQV